MDRRLSEHRVTPQCADAATLDKFPLHVEVTGQGDPLVMLHGWSMHGGIWSDTAVQLARHFRVHCVDLPGHGESASMGTFSLDNVVDQLAAQFDQPVTVCGWSLGGQIALHWAAHEPEKIHRLVLVSSTPCFAEREDWPYGMARETLQQFASDLEMNFAATLRRFLSLQARGSECERELLATLRESLFSRGEPDLDSLSGGLEILRDADLRKVLPEIMQPTLVIAGERDKLTPPEASQYLAGHLPNARLEIVRGAAHAPFLSHATGFVEHVMNFLDERKHG
jgi:pimeloyl-[acyl-carrier protein] methyl ester esterase